MSKASDEENYSLPKNIRIVLEDIKKRSETLKTKEGRNIRGRIVNAHKRFYFQSLGDIEIQGDILEIGEDINKALPQKIKGENVKIFLTVALKNFDVTY